MSRREGTLKLSSNIEPRASAPLDARTVVPTLADLTASGAFPYPYVGMIVSVQAEGKAYMLTAADPTVSANWTEIGSGGGDSIQVTELPDPATVEPGTIYQYVGEATSDYENGYFYTPQVSGTPVVSNVNLDSASDMDTLLPSPYFTKTTPSSVETVWSVNPGYAAEVTIFSDGTSQTINVIAAYIVQGDNFVAFRDDDPNHDLIPVRYMTSLCSLSVTGWERVDVQPEGSKIFPGTLDEWDALPASEKAKYSFIATPDEAVEDIADAVIDGDMRAVTSNAVFDYVPVISNMNLGSITIAADSSKIVTLSDYNINAHGKPWIAFIWNRSNWSKNVTLIGDGGSTLLIYNNNAESITGNMQIAVLHSPT